MIPTKDTVKLSALIFDDAIYPRKDHDPTLVQRYADVIEEIEAKGAYISVSLDSKILDGKHRWLAYRKRYEDNGDRDIPVLRYDVATPHEQLRLAAELNSAHGWQLTAEDKRQTAINLYRYGYGREEIKKALSVGSSQVTEWLSRIIKDERVKRDQRIFDFWLACHTQEEIAERVGCTHQAVSKITDDFATTVLEDQNCKTLASHAVGFDPPLYNVWKQQEKTAGSSHFGNSEVRWLDNLLYLYTQPFDVVIDPFAGGGSTIDVCKKRFRRYFVSDRLPIIERENEIRKHDVVLDGIPKPPQWKDVRLVYLDPPYWKQAEGRYSDDPTDLANMPLDEFTNALSAVVTDFAKKLNGNGSRIALVLQPTQWNAPERRFTDHVGDMLRQVKLPVEMRFSVPYESQQYNAQMVDWAKANRQCLVLTREIIVWKTER